MATIVVAGALANKPFSGGEAWVRMSWVLGLRRLGFDVAFVECAAADTPGAHRRWFADVVRAFGLDGRAALVLGDGSRTDGLSWEELGEVAGASDLLVNISGHLDGPLLERFRRRAYVDIDPGYTQIWAGEPGDPARLADHDVYFTIAENIGAPGCSLPTGGLRWLSTRQPVVLAEWPAAPAAEPHRFTTIATWRTPFGRLAHGGRTYGMKLDEWRKLMPLPQRCAQRFELALDIHPDERPDVARLQDHGWGVVDAHERAGNPAAFRRYVQGSAAEISVAQPVYVETRSGWFSDRTARYLAAGKPVLVQDTGFGRLLPVGEGLVAFDGLDDAAASADAIAADYDAHARAARAIAEEHFDSDRVLERFLACAIA